MSSSEDETGVKLIIIIIIINTGCCRCRTVGLPSDNDFHLITSFVSIAVLGNEISVGVTFLRYVKLQYILICISFVQILTFRKGRRAYFLLFFA